MCGLIPLSEHHAQRYSTSVRRGQEWIFTAILLDTCSENPLALLDIQMTCQHEGLEAEASDVSGERRIALATLLLVEEPMDSLLTDVGGPGTIPVLA